MIRALITDFGGVLVRTRSDRSRRELERKLGMPPHTLEDYIFGSDLSQRAQNGELDEPEFWQVVALQLDLAAHGLTAEQFRQAFFAEDYLDEELVRLIRSVRPAIKTGLISNAWSTLRAVLHDPFEIDDAFDQLVISAEEKLMKPDARIYQLALERLAVRPEEAIFLDDMPANIEAAKALGLKGIQFRSSEQAQADIRALLK
jgi:epoxide hydrolase-like predicted phosphatase